MVGYIIRKAVKNYRYRKVSRVADEGQSAEA